LFIFTPFPNTPLTNGLYKWGYHLPASLEEWGEFLYGHITDQPWLERKYQKDLITISDIVRFRYINEFGFIPRLKSKLHVVPYFFFNIFFAVMANIRWKLRFFKFPIEWRMWSWVRYKYLGHG